ncbi:MAG TPA: hypothetical protein VLX91_06125 [Candidatus Acidoferrales bacterium]|nr:hypothetical protein [Candidatus Acidoferrales bacterium]
MFGMILCLLSDSTAVDIRALVSRDIDKATNASGSASQSFVQRVLEVPEFVLITELAMILIMAGLFVALVIRFRKIAKEQNRRIAYVQKIKAKMQPSISRAEVERILNQIATEKFKAYEMAHGNYYVDYDGKLDSDEAIHEMARSHKMESERLNFALSAASQSARQGGAKFKEAFALVSEDSNLTVLARQLNMGKGELELILALKRSKIANSKHLSGSTERNGL